MTHANINAMKSILARLLNQKVFWYQETREIAPGGSMQMNQRMLKECGCLRMSDALQRETKEDKVKAKDSAIYVILMHLLLEKMGRAGRLCAA